MLLKEITIFLYFYNLYDIYIQLELKTLLLGLICKKIMKIKAWPKEYKKNKCK